jgi:glycosyltransferase involved in cell wall biosynthesis
LLAHTEIAFELIVVEQGYKAFGDCMPVQLIAEAKLRSTMHIKYRYHAAPIGYAKAVNEGVEMAGGEYLLIVNNDIEVPEQWDTRLIHAYMRPNADQRKPGMVSASDTPGAASDTIETPCSWWSCVCISREAWDAVGPLDADLLNYRLHDQDWSIRAWSMNRFVGRYHGVKVKHDESSTYRHMKIDEGPERAEMRRRYGVEHFCDYVRLPR